MKGQQISSRVERLLRCPSCGSKLTIQTDHCQCNEPSCKSAYPIISGVPILINERESIFSVDDIVHGRDTFFRSLRGGRIREVLSYLVPTVSKNWKAKENYHKIAESALTSSPTPLVLIVGGSIAGEGVAALLSFPEIELVDTDICFGPRTKVINDAHHLPFDDGSFDVVIAQAVLEHVVDPYRCVEEIYRVLKPHGMVYAETPFMQQVHGGRYDFTRFTHLGHRRLFKRFEELDSGVVCGPGMALSWSWQYFLLSFVTSRLARRLVRIFAAFTSFFLKYFDYFLIDKRGAFDAASGYYFMGKKSEHVISDVDLLDFFRGFR